MTNDMEQRRTLQRLDPMLRRGVAGVELGVRHDTTEIGRLERGGRQSREPFGAKGRRRRWAIVIFALIITSLQLPAAPSQPSVPGVNNPASKP